VLLAVRASVVGRSGRLSLLLASTKLHSKVWKTILFASLQCDTDGSAHLRSCGFLLFNALTMVCDWPQRVVRTRIDCRATFAMFGDPNNGILGNAIDADANGPTVKRLKVSVFFFRLFCFQAS